MVIIPQALRVNQRIRIKEVRLIGPNGEQMGVVPTQDALQKAQDLGLDLAEVAPQGNPPVCRIMDYSKYKYDQDKKEKEARKHQKVVHLKEIKIKPSIEEHDYQVKLKQTAAFLNKKDKVKINLFFRGREMAFKDKGRRVLNKFIEDLSECGQVEKAPDMQGRVMSIVIASKSDK